MDSTGDLHRSILMSLFQNRHMDGRMKLDEFVHRYRDIIQKSNQILEQQFTRRSSPIVQTLGLESVVLHQYQLAAIEWTLLRHERGIPCIIADEMGEHQNSNNNIMYFYIYYDVVTKLD